MKKSKKLLIALLSATCLTAGAFGLAACGNANDSAMYKIYEEYVATVPEGTTAKTYDEWLKDTLTNVGKPGDKGDQGKPGDPGKDGKSAYDLYKEGLAATETPLTQEEWLASLAGAAGISPTVKDGYWYLGDTNLNVKAVGTDGVGVKSAAMSADGKKLVFTFTDDSTKEVELPATMTHVHTYGTGYDVLLIEPTPDREGLAYKVCNQEGCDHIELVAVPTYSYKISVYLPPKQVEGAEPTPYEGATVTIKDGDKVVAEATTDEKGDAYFNDIEKKVYTYEVVVDGYKTVYDQEDFFAENKTSATQTDYVTVLFEDAESGEGTSTSPYVFIGDFDKEYDALYTYLTPEKTERYGYNLNGDVYFTFTATKPGAYAVKAIPNVSISSVSGGNYDKDSGMFFLNAGEQATVAVNSDDTLYDFIVAAVEYVQEIKPGAAMLPIPFAAGEDITVSAASADKDGYVYLYFTSEKDKYKFTSSDSGIDLSYMGFEYNNATWKFEQAIVPVTLGETVEGIGDSNGNYDAKIFKVKLSAGLESATLKAALVRVPGEDAYNAIDLAFDTETDMTNVSTDLEYVWFKYIVSAEQAGLQKFVCDYSYADYSIYTSPDQVTGYGHISGATAVYDFAEGTYYIQASVLDPDAGSQTPFKITALSEADYGLTASAPKTIALGTKYVQTDGKYLKLTAAEAGTYLFSGKNVSVYNSDTFTGTAVATAGNILELQAEQTVYIFLKYSSSEVTVTKVSEETLNTPVQYTFEVVDHNSTAIEGVTVKVNGVTGVTVADGKVTLSVVPGVYDVELDFGDKAADYEYTTKAQTKKLLEANEMRVTVNGKKDYAVIIKDKTTGAALEGIKVTVEQMVAGDKGEEGEETQWVAVNNLVTDNTGTVKFNLMSGRTYRYKLSEVPEKYEVSDSYSMSSTTTTIKLGEPKTPVDPDNPDNPDDPTPADTETYLYKGWTAEVGGDETIKLVAHNSSEMKFSINVHNGTIKYFKLTYFSYDTWDDVEYVVVENGVITEDGYWELLGVNQGDQAGNSVQFSKEDVHIELVIETNGGEKATVSIDKESAN